MTKNKS